MSSGTAELKAAFSSTAKHELGVSTYQMCILNLFNKVNSDGEISLEQITDLTKIPQNELRRHLISLCTPKHRVLLKRSSGKGLNKNDAFRVNGQFSSKLKRIRVPLVAMKEMDTHPHSSDRIP